MSKITQIQQDNKTQRILVYIDYRFCASIRPNVWEAMGLKEGDEITCAKLHQREKEVWHKARKSNYVYTAKYALTRIVQWINKYLSGVDARIIDFGFGYNRDNLVLDYPKTRHDQNISLFLKDTSTEVITLEVAITEIQKGVRHWVKADRVIYAQSQTKRDAWVVLYYRHPVERLIWIKPRVDIKYQEEELIKGSKNYFIAFYNNSSEIHTSTKFREYIQDKIDKMISETSSRSITANSLNSSNTSGLTSSPASLANSTIKVSSDVLSITTNNDHK